MPDAPSSALDRRALLLGAAGLGLGCAADKARGSASDSAGGAADSGEGDAGADIFGAPGPLLDPEGAGLPHRQGDPAWGDQLMWDRDLVIRADTELNGNPPAHARSLLRRFASGNTIRHEGCMLCCLSMVLRLFDPRPPAPWDPGLLNERAQNRYYYTLAGVSLTTLYADLVAELSQGEVQLTLKEEHLPGMPRWTPLRASASPLLRAYRGLSPAQRADCLVMVKTGTYSDVVASHYALIHPNEEAGPDEDDVQLLDPAVPVRQTGAWRLSDSAAWICQDPAIAEGWRQEGVGPLDIGGIWVFIRRRADGDGLSRGPLVRAWAAELARAAGA
jgi:hypothetical protein